jgi:hypothetical protein
MSRKVKTIKLNGRPTKYDKKYDQMLIDHMAKGFSFETFGPSIGVVTSSTYLWAQKHKSFSEAKEIGFSVSRLYWEGLGIEGSNGSDKFHCTAWVFNMKNRFNWRDNRVEETDDEVQSVTIKLPKSGKAKVISKGKKKK